MEFIIHCLIYIVLFFFTSSIIFQLCSEMSICFIQTWHRRKYITLCDSRLQRLEITWQSFSATNGFETSTHT